MAIRYIYGGSAWADGQILSGADLNDTVGILSSLARSTYTTTETFPIIPYNQISGGVILPAGVVNHFKSFTLAAGSLMSSCQNGSGLPLIIFSDGDIVINGSILMQGYDGAAGGAATGGGGGSGAGFGGGRGANDLELGGQAGSSFVPAYSPYFRGNDRVYVSTSGTAEAPDDLYNFFNATCGPGGNGGNCHAAGGYGAAGGGGGGGGTLFILANGSVTISGLILCTGGSGGNGALQGTGYGGGGGGAAGGNVIIGYKLAYGKTGIVNMSGAPGGTAGSSYNGGAGGNGAGNMFSSGTSGQESTGTATASAGGSGGNGMLFTFQW